MSELIVYDLFKKYAMTVPLDVQNVLDLGTNYAIFANVYLLSPISLHQFLNELQERVENHVWEKIKKASEK
jgi:hypothetical protein